MAAASYVSDLTDIFLFESTTGVSAYGGGGAGLGTGADFAMEGTLAVDKQITSADKGIMYDNGTNFTIGADDHFFVWILGATPGLCDTRDNHGISACIGDGTTAFVKFHVNGGDTLPLGGGQVYAVRFVNTASTNLRTLVGSPSTTPSFIGGGLSTTGSVKGANLGVDGARIGTGYDITGGTGADPEATFGGILTDDTSTSEGIFQPAPGGYILQGKLRIGSSTTECEFLDSNALVALKDTIHSLSNFTEILVEHASTILTLQNVTFFALGTTNTGRFEAITSSATINLTSCIFQGFGVTVLGTGSSCLNCTWVGSDIITANGASMIGTTVSGFEGTADTSPLIWDVATDPTTALSDMTFTKGTAATHAIEFGTNSPLTMTINDMTSSGYNASNGQNDSTFHVLRTSGTVTINVVGGTGNFTYKTAGATVVIVIDPVTTTATIVDGNTGLPVENVRVLLRASAGTGDLPYQDSVTITRSGSTASVSHTAHGMANGAKVIIFNAVQNAYNGLQTISNVTTNAYDYTVTGTPTTPATGTIIATGVVVEGLTNASGEIADTRTWTTNQPIEGTARKSTSSPYYKPGAITGTISNNTGFSSTISLIKDE